MGDMSRCRHGGYIGYCEACNPKQHIYPVEDLKPHDLTETCWCRPCVEDDLVIHNSMDERETYEQGRKPQ